MNEHGADTPDEVRVAEEWLRNVVGYLSWPDGEAPEADDIDTGDYVTVHGPFFPGETPLFDTLVAQAGDQNLRTYVSFRARQAAWDLRWSE